MNTKLQEMYANNAGRWVETTFLSFPIKVCVRNEFEKKKFVEELSICFGIGGMLSEENREDILKKLWNGLKDGQEEPVKRPY